MHGRKFFFCNRREGWEGRNCSLRPFLTKGFKFAPHPPSSKRRKKVREPRWVLERKSRLLKTCKIISTSISLRYIQKYSADNKFTSVFQDLFDGRAKILVRTQNGSNGGISQTTRDNQPPTILHSDTKIQEAGWNFIKNFLSFLLHP